MSAYICRTVERRDRSRIARFDADDPAEVAWFRQNAPRYLDRREMDDRIMTVVSDEDRENRIEAFVYWVLVPGTHVDNGIHIAAGPVWRAERWAFSRIASLPGRRTREGGRAVELLYHTFNEANIQVPATAAFWYDVPLYDPLAAILHRAEFQHLSGGTWRRPVFRLPGGTATPSAVADTPMG